MTNIEARALNVVHQATGEWYECVREALIDLAEHGAYDSVYEGDGWFNNLHVDEMEMTYIARRLIRDYVGD